MKQKYTNTPVQQFVVETRSPGKNYTNTDYICPLCKTQVRNPEPLYNVIENGKEQKWISVKDAMPATDEDVLVWNGAYCDIANAYDDDEEGRVFWVDSPESREVTHWMPLPKPPKEG